MSDDLSIPAPTYRVPRHRVGMDPLTRKLALIACGLGGTLVVVIGGWTMLGHHATTVPVVQAESGPIKVKPENPGGMQVAGANEDIMSGDGGSGVDKLAPPPETPAPQALRAPPAPPAPNPLAVPPVVAAPQPMVAAKQMLAPASLVGKPVAVPDKHAPAATADKSSPGARNTLVQLAAVRSEAEARSEWDRLSHRMPDLLGQHHPDISKIDHDGRILWRVRTGGFDDVSQATTFCEHVRAKGSGCTVADF